MSLLEKIGLGESPEQKQAREDLYKKAEAIELFPGNLFEYERMKGQECEIIELKGSQKFLISTIENIGGVPTRILIDAANAGATALIRYTIHIRDFNPYTVSGIPARLKQ